MNTEFTLNIISVACCEPVNLSVNVSCLNEGDSQLACTQ